MRISILYYTKLGHSRRIAQAIAQELQVEAQDIRTNPDIKDIDLLFIVSGIYGGVSDPTLLDFIKSMDSKQVKHAALLTSSGGKTTPASQVRSVLLNQGIEVMVDEFTCQGAIFFIGLGHPNKSDIQNAIEFAEKTIQQMNNS